MRTRARAPCRCCWTARSRNWFSSITRTARYPWRTAYRRTRRRPTWSSTAWWTPNRSPPPRICCISCGAPTSSRRTPSSWSETKSTWSAHDAYLPQVASRWPLPSTASSSRRRAACSTTSTSCWSASSSRSASRWATRNRRAVCSANGAAAGTGAAAAAVVSAEAAAEAAGAAAASGRPACASGACWAECGAPIAANRDPARTCTSSEARAGGAPSGRHGPHRAAQVNDRRPPSGRRLDRLLRRTGSSPSERLFTFDSFARSFHRRDCLCVRHVCPLPPRRRTRWNSRSGLNRIVISEGGGGIEASLGLRARSATREIHSPFTVVRRWSVVVIFIGRVGANFGPTMRPSRGAAIRPSGDWPPARRDRC